MWHCVFNSVGHPPLFTTIPLTNVVIDNLHLFLRIADVLINLLILELKSHDAIDKNKSFTSFDAEKYFHIFAFHKSVTRLGIADFQFYVGKTSKQLKCRSLTGPEKIKVFQNIKTTEMLSNSSNQEAYAIFSICGMNFYHWMRFSQNLQEI